MIFIFILITQIVRRKQSFFKRLTKRLSIINNAVGKSKLFSLALETAKELGVPFRTVSALSQTRFFSSNYKEVKKLLVSLPGYIETFLDHKAGDDELEFSISSQDFLYDVLGFLDIFKPFNELMTISQGLDVSPWRMVSLVKKVESLVKQLDNDLKNGDLRNFKYLSTHKSEVDGFKFKEAELKETIRELEHELFQSRVKTKQSLETKEEVRQRSHETNLYGIHENET
mgnify:CR=1 FL=1